MGNPPSLLLVEVNINSMSCSLFQGPVVIVKVDNFDFIQKNEVNLKLLFSEFFVTCLVTFNIFTFWNVPFSHILSKFSVTILTLDIV